MAEKKKWIKMLPFYIVVFLLVDWIALGKSLLFLIPLVVVFWAIYKYMQEGA